MSAKVSTVADADGRGISIELEGLQELRRDLMAFDKRLNYKLQARFRRIGNTVAADARVLTGRLADIHGDKETPSRPSPLAAKTPEIVAGIKVQTKGSRSNRQVVVRVVQTSREGSIVEFAHARHSPQGYAFVRMLERRNTPGRFVWEAADRNKPYIFREVAAAVAKAEAELSEGLGI